MTETETHVERLGALLETMDGTEPNFVPTVLEFARHSSVHVADMLRDVLPSPEIVLKHLAAIHALQAVFVLQEASLRVEVVVHRQSGPPLRSEVSTMPAPVLPATPERSGPKREGDPN